MAVMSRPRGIRQVFHSISSSFLFLDASAVSFHFCCGHLFVVDWNSASVAVNSVTTGRPLHLHTVLYSNSEVPSAFHYISSPPERRYICAPLSVDGRADAESRLALPSPSPVSPLLPSRLSHPPLRKGEIEPKTCLRESSTARRASPAENRERLPLAGSRASNIRSAGRPPPPVTTSFCVRVCFGDGGGRRRA